ncbi:MAG: 50S ribosomal protein L4 [Bacteroidota bacterium]
MKLEVLNVSGDATGRSVELPDSVFGEQNEHAVYLAVKAYLAAQRQGTHKAKEKGEITASTKKIKRQKGTGTARAGSVKSGVMRGGGRIFGPRPRKYTQKLNKKVKQVARRSAIASKLANGQVKVVENFTFEAPKTKQYVEVLSSLGIEGKSLLVLGDYDNNVLLSSRNVQKAGVVAAAELNTYEVMNAGTLVLSEGAVEKIVASLS